MKTNPYAAEVTSLINDLINDGFKITHIDDGDGWEETTADTVIDSILGVDDSNIRVKKEGGKGNSIYLVLGNEPGVIVADYSCDDDLDRITDAHYKKFNQDEE